MRLSTPVICLLSLIILFAAAPSVLLARQSDAIDSPVPALPEAPAPRVDTFSNDNEQDIADQVQQTQAPQQTQAKQPSSDQSTSNSSSSEPASQQPTSQQTQKEKAAEQIKEQEQQRVEGVIPNFNVTYRHDAVSMTPGQKIGLAFRSSVDPFTFAAGFLAAGYHEVLDDDPGFPWGIKGYGERSGAAYLDAFNGTMIGNGFLPALFHQDPRYFRLGYGSRTHRMLYALATNVICKHDNTGKWEPNYSNVGGNLIAGAISNLYYPPVSRSGVGLTFSNGLVVTAEGGIGSLFNEFWPDLSRRFLHKDPTHGLDAQMQAEDKQKKQEKKAAKEEQKQQQQPSPVPPQ
jgi:DNA mismatch repair ATPase MutL